MTSLPPSSCCFEHSIHTGTRQGKLHENLFGLHAYETGPKGSKKVLIISIDIFGHDFLNTNLIADEFARKGYYVLVPDILDNDPLDFQQAGMEGFKAWLKNHSYEYTQELFHNFIIKAKETFVKDAKIFSAGYCFGAPYAITELAEEGLLTAGAIAHPSRVEKELVEKIRKPIIIGAAQHDGVFPAVLRRETEDILISNDVRFESVLFSHASHGFAIKGDLSVPAVKYAKEKCFVDFLSFFENFA